MAKKTRSASHSTEMNVASARQLLKSVGLRCTASRIALLQQLAKSSQPLSHNELVEILTETGFDASTVFRGLVELADCGLLTRLDVGDQIRRYELKHFTKRERSTGAGEVFHADEHPHFVCIDCGQVTCLTDVTVTLTRKEKRVASPGNVTEVLIKGHCNGCK